MISKRKTGMMVVLFYVPLLVLHVRSARSPRGACSTRSPRVIACFFFSSTLFSTSCA